MNSYDLSNVLVDEADRHVLDEYKWRVRPDGYVICPKGQSLLLLHRILMRPTGKDRVDHINGNPSDNRRSNLRVCTHQQNISHRMGKRRWAGATSKYAGVGWYRRDALWRARIMCFGKDIQLGMYASEEAAARAYDAAAKKYFGEFAHLNFPDE